MPNDYDSYNRDYFFDMSQARGELASTTSILKMIVEAEESDNQMMKEVVLQMVKDEIVKNEKFLEPAYRSERQKEREALSKEALEHEKRMDEVKL